MKPFVVFFHERFRYPYGERPLFPTLVNFSSSLLLLSLVSDVDPSYCIPSNAFLLVICLISIHNTCARCFASITRTSRVRIISFFDTVSSKAPMNPENMSNGSVGQYYFQIFECFLLIFSTYSLIWSGKRAPD